jgi:hypothetical protein
MSVVEHYSGRGPGLLSTVAGVADPGLPAEGSAKAGPRSPNPATPAISAKPSRLWLWFIAVFALQLAGWTTWVVIASHHEVQEVPLEKVGRVVPNPPPQDVRTQTER